MATLNKILGLLTLLGFSSNCLYGQVAEIRHDSLTVPEIVAGETVYRGEFSLINNTDPVRFELVSSASVSNERGLLSATFDNGVLHIPEVLFKEKLYWLKLNDTGNNIFSVVDWGLSSEPTPPFDHSAAFQIPQWRRLNGSAYDIGVGANGDAWVVGTNFERGGFGIFNVTGSRGFGLPGGAIRIDVDAEGNPWIINDEDRIYRWREDDWERLPGEALDIGIGADGSVWVTSYEGVYRFNGVGWDDFGGGGSRIDVGPDGQPWVVGFSERIYTLQDGQWRRLSGEASDIGVGADGSVWVVSPLRFSLDGFEEPRRIYRWNGFGWDRIDGDAIDISVGPDGMPWVTNFFADIYRGI